MTTVYPITIQSADFAVDPSFTVYLVDATSGNITITLPDTTLLTDGVNFIFRRLDSSINTVTLQGFSPTQTVEGVVSVYIQIDTTDNIISYNGVWYYYNAGF